MGLYDRLAPHYDAFFPQNPAATSFLLGLARRGEADGGRTRAAGGAGERPLAVDFGCATGSQALDLAAAGWRAIGWEPCAAMLEIARGKAAALALDARFEPYPMQEAASRIPPASVDLALCLGNTLPHLRGEDELARFAADLALIVAPGGFAALQLLNYGLALRRIRDGTFSFPALRAAGAAFERSYSLAPGGKLAFRGELAEGGRLAAEESLLTPFALDAIARRLEDSGFEDLRPRSGWESPTFDPQADPYLILTARRR